MNVMFDSGNNMQQRRILNEYISPVSNQLLMFRTCTEVFELAKINPSCFEKWNIVIISYIQFEKCDMNCREWFLKRLRKRR